ncbi:NAD-dependent epimerase/dehydratase family protein [Flexithrix dorotheae]|uniref:NAD-dependent epimerase/dehydratase family protein n=1 Tax=Flexithrix dorotheae TaxID=70993 RepID=UPI0003760D70|nr:NAD-dependent epimerase/dehydratase family protein [Flexithrix dorotheae]
MNTLLSGSSGFLGQYLLQKLQPNCTTIGRSSSNAIFCDLSTEIPVLNQQFDLVVHNAGKAHVVPKTQAEREDFFKVNVAGTKHLLKSLEQSPGLPGSFIFISTVAVYGREVGENIAENTSLMAQDPYGRSKIEAEEMIREWGRVHGVKTGILRLPLIVGNNPPGNLGAMIKAIQKGYYFNIGQGQARRSMVLAEDVAEIIPKLVQTGGTFNLTDGCHPSYSEISQHIGKMLHKPVRNLSNSIALTLAGIGSGIQVMTQKSFPFNKRAYSKMTSSLTFSDEKAKEVLGWQPRSVLAHLDELV